MPESESEPEQPRRADHAMLDRCVQDARLMIAYLAQSNLEASPSQFQHLIESARIPVADWDSVREVKFWKQMNALVKAIHPATIETIEVNTDISVGDDARLNERRRFRKRVVRRFSWFGLMTIITVLFVQIYWVVGSTVYSSTLETEAKWVSLIEREVKLNDEINEIDNRLTRRRAEEATPAGEIEKLQLAEQLRRLTERDKQQLQATIDSAEDKRATLYAIMKLTTLGLQGLLVHGSSDDDADAVEADQVVLDLQGILNAATVEYVLPLLLGLMGACVYVLREIFHEIQRKTFLPERAVGFRLRLYLGMISGLTFAWLFAWVIPNGQESGLGAASPLAIAFLVGYSVELLFSSLDRLIASLARDKAADSSPSSGDREKKKDD